MKLFISYSHKDMDAVKELAALLESGGHQVWWDADLTTGGVSVGMGADRV